MDSLDNSKLNTGLKPAMLIINPVSGKKLALRYIPQMIRALMDGGYLVTTVVTAKRGDATEFAARYGRQYELICCTGGDGTLNEVINGAVGFDNAAVTHFPGGSGNDMIKMFSETAPFSDLERLLDCDEAQFDLIRCNETHSANILSMGLDARIGTEIARYKKLPLLSGHGAYLASTLVNLIKGISQHFVITLDDGTRLDDKFTLICACNGRWYGGGFNPVPEAEPDDGLLDVLVVEKVSLLQVASVIGHYQKGRYAD